ncbi:MAG TPA: hypothetical protein VK913_11195, partial [Erythrobacter sp.]|nr:hypothetical protein [Erythrobacter sp.]
VFAHPAVKLVFGAFALRHTSSFKFAEPPTMSSHLTRHRTNRTSFLLRPPLHRGAGPIAKARA